MQKELEQIIKDNNLEGTRIQVGRQRIYPQREGLNATPEQLENLKAVIAGNSVKGSLRITAGDVVVAANTAGAIEKAFDSGLLPNQPKPSEVNLMQSTTEAPTIEVKSAAPAIETKAKAPVMESQTEIPLMENETEVSLMESEVEVPTIEATSSQNSFASMHTNLDEMGVNLDRMEVLIEQLDPDSNVIDAKSQFESGTQDQETSLDNVEVDTQPEQVTSTAVAPAEAKQQTAAAQETYFNLLTQHPEFRVWHIATYEELRSQSDDEQKVFDRQMSKIALEQQLPKQAWERLMRQGSPYIQTAVASGSLSTAQDYLSERAIVYQHRLESQAVTLEHPQVDAEDARWEPTPREHYIGLSDAFYNDRMFPGDDYSDLFEKALKDPHEGRQNDTQVVLAAFRLKQSPEQLEEVLSESPYVQSQVGRGVAHSEMRDQYVAPIVAQYKVFYDEKITKGAPEENLLRAVEQVGAAQEQVISNPEVAAAPTVTTPAPAEAKQFDFPATAHSIDPAKDFRDTVQRGAVTLQTHAVSARETLELAQKNLTTFAKHVKHRGFKAWAKDQLPILQNKAKELVQTQATKLGEYAKEQAPIVRDAAITGAKQAAQTVVSFAKEQAPILAEKAKEFGGVVVERVAEYSRLVDPVRVEAFGAHILGNDGGFEGNTFDFSRTDSGGIQISLKDGTPVFENGKLNPGVDTSYAYRLGQMAEKMEAVKAQPEQVEEKKKAVSR